MLYNYLFYFLSTTTTLKFTMHDISSNHLTFVIFKYRFMIIKKVIVIDIILQAQQIIIYDIACGGAGSGSK